jgi:hypothetical protein
MKPCWVLESSKLWVKLNAVKQIAGTILTAIASHELDSGLEYADLNENPNTHEKSQNLKQIAKPALFFMRTFLFFGENYKAHLHISWSGDES